MRRSCLLLAASLLATALLASTDPPKLRLGEVEDVWPKDYSAELTLDPDKTAFDAVLTINLDVRKPIDVLWLNANKLTVKTAAVTAGANMSSATVLPGGDDFIGFKFDSPLPTGAASIKITYSGVIRVGDSSGAFQTEDKGNHYILTQFEATDARDVFPCFDEPLYKVPWQLTIKHPSKYPVISNTPIHSEFSENDRTTTFFEQTKPLPSYLVAFGVGPFEFVNAGTACARHIPVRIVTPKGRANEAKYAAEVTADILTRLEQYFGIPYPYDKADQVAIPVIIGFGAMENAGMVTYGQTIILADPKDDSIARQRGYATTAAHELSHQWFGDLVTTSWWDDIWLNEAFATWMEQKLVASWKPEWETGMDAVDAKLGAEGQDSLTSARQIRQPIESKGDIGNAFDSITYQKGAAVIGMFESWMGPDNFRAGVRNYLTQYAFKTTTASDFLDAVSSGAKKNVTAPFSTFLNQPGVPVVTGTLKCDQGPGVLHLEQQRFLPLGSTGGNDQSWQIPVCIRYGTGATGKSECTLMTGRTLDWKLSGSSCPAWVQLNDDAKGYYRMAYSGGLLAALAEGDVRARLNGPERVELVGNAQAATRSGQISEADALKLAVEFHDDPKRDVVERSLSAAQSPRLSLVPPGMEANYQRFLEKTFGPQAHALGWKPKSSDTPDMKLLRPTIVGDVAKYAADKPLAEEARQLAEAWFQNHDAVSPDVLGAVLSTAAYYGNQQLFEQFLAEFQKSQNPQQKQELVFAVDSFRDPAAIREGFDVVRSRKIPLADGIPLMFMGGESPASQKVGFEYFMAHYDEVMKDHPRIFGFDLGGMLPQIGGRYCDAGLRQEYNDFFAPKVSQFEGAPRTFRNALEQIDLCLAYQKAQQPSLVEFLKNY